MLEKAPMIPAHEFSYNAGSPLLLQISTWQAVSEGADRGSDRAAGSAAVPVQVSRGVLVWGSLPCRLNCPDLALFRCSTTSGTQWLLAHLPHMNERQRIRLTLEQIKVAKKLVAQQLEFIVLAKTIGYEPVHATATLERFCVQLSRQRQTLVRLTRNEQGSRALPSSPSPLESRRAA